ITIIAALYLLLSGNLFSLNFLLIMQILALAVMLWARRSFQPSQFSIHAQPEAGRLLNSGPYQFVRHPMYAAALLMIWAGILGHFSPLNLVIGMVVTGVIWVRILVEEQLLRTNYPGYGTYSNKTKRLIPFVV
ncbi:MAG TPA: isoprenylcysteine carboxylmethyltransferase family protein, partial [Caldilineaceae bacterium]|nr:isoprenylcysteine carboxylmethyltransferase family protein [Caldilineaceae bacterium]